MTTITELTELELLEYNNNNLLNNLTDAVQRHMDLKVGERNYDNIGSAVDRVNSSNPVKQTEGLACVNWRDAVWDHCDNILTEVKAGLRPIPTQEELLSSLPLLNW